MVAADISFSALSGADILTHESELARLRISVFRDFPYLYEGTMENEQRYLSTYRESPRARVYLALDAGRVVGASTVVPLSDADEETRRPFAQAGIDLSAIDYFGESVVLRSHRGRGIGVRFFALREAHAVEYGLTLCTFCAVVRPKDHRARPADYVPHDEFWVRRGYSPWPELSTSFSWLDVGAAEKSDKPMTFWRKQLG